MILSRRTEKRTLIGARSRVGVLLLATAAIAMLTAALHPATASDEFERIREKAAEMVVAVNGAFYDADGDGKASELDRTYGDYGYLINDEKLESISGLVSGIADSALRAERERTSNIIRFHAMQAAVAPVIDNYRNSLREKSMVVDGDKVVLQGLEFRMGLQESQDVRRNWWLAAKELYKGVNVYLRSLLFDLDEKAQELGYDSYYAFLTEAQQWDIDSMRSAAETLLTETKSEYEELLEAWASQELDLRLRKVRAYDAARLAFFPALSKKAEVEKPEEVAAATMKELGFDLGKQRTMRIDIRERDGRDPVGTAHQISTGKTYVTMVPSGFLSDIQDLLGTLGEAEFYHNIPGDLPFEKAYFGNAVLPCTYRALCELIVEEPAWISRHLKLDGVTAEEVASAFRLRRLMDLRRSAGQFLFQLQLHEDPGIAPEVFAEQMEAALLWKHTANDADAYLSRNDDYRSGARVFGHRIAVEIRKALREEWGPEWFRNDELAKRMERGASRGYDMGIDEFLRIWNINGEDASLLASPQPQG